FLKTKYCIIIEGPPNGSSWTLITSSIMAKNSSVSGSTRCQSRSDLSTTILAYWASSVSLSIDLAVMALNRFPEEVLYKSEARVAIEELSNPPLRQVATFTSERRRYTIERWNSFL